MILVLPVYVLLSYFTGLETSFSLKDDMVDALVAYAGNSGTGGAPS